MSTDVGLAVGAGAEPGVPAAGGAGEAVGVGPEATTGDRAVPGSGANPGAGVVSVIPSLRVAASRPANTSCAATWYSIARRPQLSPASHRLMTLSKAAWGGSEREVAAARTRAISTSERGCNRNGPTWARVTGSQ